MQCDHFGKGLRSLPSLFSQARKAPAFSNQRTRSVPMAECRNRFAGFWAAVFEKTKIRPKDSFRKSLRRINTPRYHSNCAFAPLVGLQQALCTNAAHSEDVYYLCGCFCSELRCSALKYREYVFSPAPCSAAKSSRKFGKRLFLLGTRSQPLACKGFGSSARKG